MTLIEVLAVITILALAAGVLGGGVLEGSRGHRLRQAEGSVREIDDLARLLARRGQPTIISIAERGTAIVARKLESRHQMARRELPEGVTARLEADHDGYVLVSGGGASRDYAVHLSLGDRQSRIAVAGATGWIIRERDDP
jgi:type II secretory pathway pseudopilin PulG